MERFKMPVAVHLFLIQQESILLLRRYHTGYEDGNYSVVAGHVEEGENVIEAMQREAKEEAGITIQKQYLQIIQVMNRKSGDKQQKDVSYEERIDYFFYCDTYEGMIENKEPNKCDDLSFYPIKDLPQNIIPYVREAIENYQNRVNFSLFGWNEE